MPAEISGPLHALFVRWSYRGRGYLRNFTVVVLNSPENLAIVQIGCPWESSFYKFAVSYIVSRDFYIIFADSPIWVQLYFKVDVHELFYCVLRTMQHITLTLPTLQHQRYLELSYLSYLSDRKLCFLLSFRENCGILVNFRQNRCQSSRVLSWDQ